MLQIWGSWLDLQPKVSFQLLSMLVKHASRWQKSLMQAQVLGICLAQTCHSRWSPHTRGIPCTMVFGKWHHILSSEKNSPKHNTWKVSISFLHFLETSSILVHGRGFYSLLLLFCSYWMVSGEVRQSDCCLMDSKNFNQIGVGVDDLIEAYMQVWPT